MPKGGSVTVNADAARRSPPTDPFSSPASPSQPAKHPQPAALAFLSSSQSPKRAHQTHPNRLPFPSLIHSQIFLPKFADHCARSAHNGPMIALPKIIARQLPSSVFCLLSPVCCRLSAACSSSPATGLRLPASGFRLATGK